MGLWRDGGVEGGGMKGWACRGMEGWKVEG